MRLRGRTGIREDLIAQPELVLLEPTQWKGRWHERFGNDKPIHVELGMGKGKFISEMSRNNPDINYVGIDMFDELLRRGAEKAKAAHEGEPSNLALALWNIERIEEVFAPGEIERVYLNFSDPWPKKRHAKRRLTHQRFVRKYMELLNEQGEVHLKTDSRLLFEFSLNSFADLGLRMRNISLDLHGNGPAPDNVMTEYETKFHDQGMNIYRCEVMIGSRALDRHLSELSGREAAEARTDVTP